MAQRVVGLDIGSSAVRAVELTVGDGSKPVLEAFGQVGLRTGVVVDGEVRDPHAVVHALRRLWQEGGFTEKRVRVGVAGLRAITRELDMPLIPPDELNDAVRFRADEVVPFPIEQTAISSKVIAQYADSEGAQTLRVLVAAAHRDLVDSLVSVVLDAGLEPENIDLNTAALVRCLHDPHDTDAPEAIVSVGAGLTLVVVHEMGVLQFVRTIDLGGEAITRSIASALDLPFVDAEALKRKLDQSGVTDVRARNATAEAVDELVVEIRNSVRFFSSLPGRSPVGQVLVTGGGAQVARFLPRLQQELDVPVRAASPLSAIDTGKLPISPEQAATIEPTLAVPVGLALPESSGRPFNLLPPEISERVAARKLRRQLRVGALGLVVLIAGLSGWRVLEVHDAQNQVNDLNRTISVIRDVQIPKYDKAVKLRDSVLTLQKLPVPVVSTEVDWLTVLGQLSQFQPPNAIMTNVTLTASSPTTSSSISRSPSTRSATGTTDLPAPTSIVGSVSASVTVPDLSAVTTWGQSMSAATAVTQVDATGTLAPGPSGVTFTATMDVTGVAHTQRLDQFLAPIPPAHTRTTS